MSQPPTPAAILQTGLAFWPAKTLLSAIELGLFTELAAGPQGYEALRTRLGLHARSEAELRRACELAGLKRFERVRTPPMLIFRAERP